MIPTLINATKNPATWGNPAPASISSAPNGNATKEGKKVILPTIKANA